MNDLCEVCATELEGPFCHMCGTRSASKFVFPAGKDPRPDVKTIILLSEKDLIASIKRYRNIYGCSLFEAKEIVSKEFYKIYPRIK
jgi:ribosomal protein L7/L12